MNSDFYLPYLVNYSQPVPEQIVILIVSMLVAVLVSAEAQAMMATILGDVRRGATDRLHFNVFMHLSLLGTLNFFIAGFAWPKEIEINSARLKGNPRLLLLLCRLAGPVANLLMANIAASLTWILGRWDFDDQVFSSMAVVNVTMAIYGLLLIPPLPGASLLYAFFPGDPGRFDRWKKIYRQAGPFIILIGFLLIRLSGWDGISAFISPIVLSILGFING